MLNRWLVTACLALTCCGCAARPPAPDAPAVVVRVGERPSSSVVVGPVTTPARTQPPKAGLLTPKLATSRAPDTFVVRVETTRGTFAIRAVRRWAPRGVDRFYNLVALGYYQDIAFYRVVPGFVAQFGIHGDPQVNRAWRDAPIAADTVAHTNLRGTVTFAQTSNRDSRTVQLFINLTDHPSLDALGFAPIGEVINGMGVVDALYGGYGEQVTRLQGRMLDEGNGFLKTSFPQLDYLLQAELAR